LFDGIQPRFKRFTALPDALRTDRLVTLATKVSYLLCRNISPNSKMHGAMSALRVTVLYNHTLRAEHNSIASFFGHYAALASLFGGAMIVVLAV
jgi:hypothetical protein